YVGDKQSSGTEVDKAGLTNGTLKFVNVVGSTAEVVNTTTRATNITNGTRFNLSATASTTFSRPEDGAWNPLNPTQYYFVTTDQLDQVADGLGSQIGRTRLWRLTFDDITNPDAGGVVDLLIDGQTVAGQKVNMFDNMTVNKATGRMILLEDVGGATHNGKVWEFDPATFNGTTNSGNLVMIAKHDVARFGDRVNPVTTAATSPFNNDEESSGIIDITGIMAGSAMYKGNPGEAWYISSDQAHYTTGVTTSQVEGGQFFVLHQIAPTNNLQVTRSGYVRDRRTGLYAQQLTLKNNQASQVSGPFSVALDSLTFNVSLANANGTTANFPTLGNSYISVPGSALAPGASTTVTLQFANPSNTAIDYAPRTLNGTSTAP
ncbi:MAG: alkaline phosphatase PhoX, partial [Luteolibacter sp.]